MTWECYGALWRGSATGLSVGVDTTHVEARHGLLQLVELLHHAEELAAHRDVDQEVYVLLVLIRRVQRYDERVLHLVERVPLAHHCLATHGGVVREQLLLVDDLHRVHAPRELVAHHHDAREAAHAKDVRRLQRLELRHVAAATAATRLLEAALGRGSAILGRGSAILGRGSVVRCAAAPARQAAGARGGRGRRGAGRAG